MSGIYIHIPFCKQRCTYCDFYTQVAPQLIPDLIDAIVKELHLRKNYLSNKNIQTIYFGGGTPSLLNFSQFSKIFDTIYSLFKVNSDAEITFEANPDDLSDEFLKSIAPLPFNRISIGVQSFNDADLKLVNRRHTGLDAINAINRCRANGINNISLDLIYGLPNQSIDNWKTQLAKAFELKVQHISVYGLTYEPGTRLWKQREMGKVYATEDDTMNKMYDILLSEMQKYGYEAYEISNFALKGYRSKHNSAYWKMNPYLGLGPSAHSFNGNSRQWNVSSNKKYIQAIKNNDSFFEVELLTEHDQYNDFVMVSLRTSDGIKIDDLEKKYGIFYKNYCINNAQKYINNNKITIINNALILTTEGILVSNMIISDLMFV